MCSRKSTNPTGCVLKNSNLTKMAVKVKGQGENSSNSNNFY